MGKHKVPSIDPIYGGLLICAADPVVVHGSHFLAIHQKIYHVGAIFKNAVFQAVGVRNRSVNAIGAQCNAVVIISSSVGHTKGNKIAVVTAVQIRGVCHRTGCVACKQQCAVRGIGPCSL